MWKLNQDGSEWDYKGRGRGCSLLVGAPWTATSPGDPEGLIRVPPKGNRQLLQHEGRPHERLSSIYSVLTHNFLMNSNIQRKERKKLKAKPHSR
jgi:hypothetical protein